MASQQQVKYYRAKYAFNGKSNENQLVFSVGALIIARTGQEGKAWWWGSCNGRDGWFPPTYVTPAQAPTMSSAPTSQSNNSMSKKDLMSSTTFTSSTAVHQNKVKHQQTAMRNNMSTAATSSDPFSGMSAMTQSSSSGIINNNNLASVMNRSSVSAMNTSSDPFAGLDLAPSSTTGPSATSGSPFPTPSVNTPGNSAPGLSFSTTTMDPLSSTTISGANSTISPKNNNDNFGLNKINSFSSTNSGPTSSVGSAFANMQSTSSSYGSRTASPSLGPTIQTKTTPKPEKPELSDSEKLIAERKLKLQQLENEKKELLMKQQEKERQQAKEKEEKRRLQEKAAAEKEKEKQLQKAETAR
jgi:hypothetical protein